MIAIPGDDPYESVIFQADTGAMDRLLQSLFGIRSPTGYRLCYDTTPLLPGRD